LAHAEAEGHVGWQAGAAGEIAAGRGRRGRRKAARVRTRSSRRTAVQKRQRRGRPGRAATPRQAGSQVETHFEEDGEMAE